MKFLLQLKILFKYNSLFSKFDDYICCTQELKQLTSADGENKYPADVESQLNRANDIFDMYGVSWNFLGKSEILFSREEYTLILKKNSLPQLVYRETLEIPFDYINNEHSIERFFKLPNFSRELDELIEDCRLLKTRYYRIKTAKINAVI